MFDWFLNLGKEDIINDVIHSRIFLLLILIGYIALLPWQIVGLWRSTNNHIKEKGDMFIDSIVMLLIVLEVGIILWVPFIIRQGLEDRFYNSIGSYEEGGYYITPAIFYDNAIIIRGQFNIDIADSFEKILKDNPETKTVVLESDGGLSSEGKKLFEIISKNQLNTYVSKYCASACTDAFIAGKKRSIHSDAELGFHQVKPAFLNRQFTEKELYLRIEKDVELFHKQGVSKEFTSKMHQSKPEDMWLPSHQELLDYGVIHKVGKL
jgi:hypothetical protein